MSAWRSTGGGVLNRHFPTVTQAVFLVFVLIAVQLLFGLAVRPVARAAGDSRVATGLTLFGYCLSFGVVILLSLRRSGLRWKERMATGPGSIFFPPAVVLTVAGLQVLLSELDNLFRLLLPARAGGPDIMELVTAGESLAVVFVLLAVIAPLAEETLFRGIMLRGFLRNYSPVKALLVSALVFAVSHMNLSQLAGAFVLGVYLAYLFRETRSLSLCMGAHLLNNAMPFLFLHLLGLEIPGFTAVSRPVSFQPLWLDLLGAAGVLAGTALTWLHYRGGNARGTGSGREQG
jgi:hypothetical protein